jgi:Transferase family
MTKARLPSIRDPAITKSKLLIPVNIRKKLKEPISESYLGAAVDFATAELSISALSASGADNPSALAETALVIRRAIENVDEAYIRQAIALSLVKDPNIDVRDLMASNMNRTEGADMYITSWERLGLYDATLGMGLGRPDWVRKPWSKDPGSCVIMPSDDRKPYMEVLVQMTESDMERLLADEVFISYVIRTSD